MSALGDVVILARMDVDSGDVTMRGFYLDAEDSAWVTAAVERVGQPTGDGLANLFDGNPATILMRDDDD